MKHPIFFLFFVLVTASVINTTPLKLSKRATQFHPCTSLDISMSPDPIVSGQNVTFSISGTPTIDINNATAGIYFFGDKFYQEFKADLCKLYKCPVKKDTKFDSIKSEQLPATYNINVLILNFPQIAFLHCASTYYPQSN